MSGTVLDDRDFAITYLNGAWIKGGDPVEYRGTTSWSMSTGATATIDFYGDSIRVLATTHLRTGVPANTTLNLAFVLRDESSTIAQNRAVIEQPAVHKYNVQIYASPQLTGNSVKRQLAIQNLTPGNLGFLCLDSVYIGAYTTTPGPASGQSGSDPPPSSSSSTTSTPAPTSTVTTSTTSESGSTTSAPNTTTSTTPSASSTSSSALFGPIATDELTSMSVEGGSGGGGSSQGDSNQANPTSAAADKNRHIVTGVLGGLVGLLALGILCWFIFVRRRNRRKEFAQDQQQTFASPYTIGRSMNPETASSAAGSEINLLPTTGRNDQNDHMSLSATGTQMQEVFGGSGLSSARKGAWNSNSTRQCSGSGQEDAAASPPPYTTSV